MWVETRYARKPGHARVRRAHRSRHGCRPSASRRRALSQTRSSMPNPCYIVSLHGAVEPPRAVAQFEPSGASPRVMYCMMMQK